MKVADSWNFLFPVDAVQPSGFKLALAIAAAVLALATASNCSWDWHDGFTPANIANRRPCRNSLDSETARVHKEVGMQRKGRMKTAFAIVGLFAVAEHTFCQTNVPLYRFA